MRLSVVVKLKYKTRSVILSFVGIKYSMCDRFNVRDPRSCNVGHLDRNSTMRYIRIIQNNFFQNKNNAAEMISDFFWIYVKLKCFIMSPWRSYTSGFLCELCFKLWSFDHCTSRTDGHDCAV